MIGGKSWLDLAVVAAAVMALVTLMLVIQALDRGRPRSQIIRVAALLWGAVGLTIGMGWLLDIHWGGALFDVELIGDPRVVSRQLSTSEMVLLGIVLAAMAALYVVSIAAVRRLLERDTDELKVRPADGGEAR